MSINPQISYDMPYGYCPTWYEKGVKVLENDRTWSNTGAKLLCILCKHRLYEQLNGDCTKLDFETDSGEKVND